jgi:hypothetical protein
MGPLEFMANLQGCICVGTTYLRRSQQYRSRDCVLLDATIDKMQIICSIDGERRITKMQP